MDQLHQIHSKAFRPLMIAILITLLLSPVPLHVASAGDLTPEADDAVFNPTRDSTPGFVPLINGCSRIDLSAVNADYEQRVVELVNEQRAANGLPPLKRQVDLDFAARFHAKDLIDDNYFKHDSYDRQNGSLVLVCKWSDRVYNFYNGNSIAENIAAGYSTPEVVMEGWMNSSGHRANILGASYRELGVGYYSGGGDYGRYWVQDFGKRNNVYPIVINAEAARTDSTQVNLYIYGAGTWTEMRLANDNGSWNAWQAFQPSLNWTLPGTKGKHTVNVELRKTDGATTTSSDDIELTRDSGITLGNLPDSIGFIYNQAAGKLTHASSTVLPLNTQSSVEMAWSLAVDPQCNWINLSKTSGTSPNDSFTISPQMSEYVDPEYSSYITVTASGSAAITDSPKVIQIWVRVVKDLPYSMYLPVTAR